MAVSREQMRNAIKGYEKQGLGGRQILIALAKRQDEIGKVYNELISEGVTPDEFGRTFGLTFAQGKTASNGSPEVNKNPSFVDKVKATAMSSVMGLADMGGGAVQGGYYLTDKLGITKGAYDKYNKDFEVANQVTQEYRANAGRSGSDFVRAGTKMVAELPFYLGTGGTGGVLLNAGKAGLVGAGLGVAHQAKDSDSRLQNAVIGGLSGAGGEVAGRALTKVAGKVAPKVSSTARASANARMDSVVERELLSALRASGIALADLPTHVANGLRADVKEALKAGKAVDATAVARKAVFDRLGLTPTKAQLTGSAKDWQRQAELAKINGAGDPLRDKFIQDNADLSRLLDDVVVGTGGRATDDYGAMDGAIGALKGHANTTKDFVSSAYHLATKADGNQVVLNATGFASDAIKQLDEAYALSSLPSSIHKMIKDIDKNPSMFTLGKSEELIKILNREHRASKINGQETSATFAIGVVRDALEKRQREAVTELLARMGDDKGNEALNLYRFARQAHKMRAEQVEQIPLLKDAIRGVEPDKLFNKHILSGNITELDKTVQLLRNVNPQVVDDIRGQVAEYIYKKATSSKSGQPSPVQMSRALERLGDRRLNILFNKDEVARLKDIEKAMDFMITQPAHSYVNNSNTVSSAVNFLANFIKTPGVRMVLSPVKDVVDSMAVKKAMKSSVASDTKLASSTARQIDGMDDLLKVGGAVGASVGSNMGGGDVQSPTPVEKPYLYEAKGVDNYFADDNLGGQGGVSMVGNPFSPSMPQSQSSESVEPLLNDNSAIGGMGQGVDDNSVHGETMGSHEPESIEQSVVGQVGNGLFALIPPPKDVDNPQKQAVFERVAGNAVGAVLRSEPMRAIVRELSSGEPNELRLQAMQQALSKTPEWQDFLKVLPAEQRNMVRGANILQLLTNTQIHGNSALFNPVF